MTGDAIGIIKWIRGIGTKLKNILFLAVLARVVSYFSEYGVTCHKVKLVALPEFCNIALHSIKQSNRLVIAQAHNLLAYLNKLGISNSSTHSIVNFHPETVIGTNNLVWLTKGVIGST